MPLNTTNTAKRPRLSYAQERPDISGPDPVRERAPDLKKRFELERCPYHAREMTAQSKTEAERRAAFKRMRGSQMVRRDRPYPELKPAPDMARGPDRAAFNQSWTDEQRNARRAAKLAEAKAMKAELENHIAYLDREEQSLNTLDARARSGDVEGATREGFKMMRRIQQESARVRTKSHSVRQGLQDN